MTYKLVGADSKLKDHVGHKVEISGTVDKSSAGTTGSTSDQPGASTAGTTGSTSSAQQQLELDGRPAQPEGAVGENDRGDLLARSQSDDCRLTD